MSRLRKYMDLPKGTRFKYLNGEKTYVILEHHGKGLVAEWTDPNLNKIMQGIYTAMDTELETASLVVEVVG